MNYHHIQQVQHKRSLLRFQGNFHVTGMEENRKTGHSITEFSGDFGLGGGTSTLFATSGSELKYNVIGTFDNTTKILTFEGERNTSQSRIVAILQRRIKWLKNYSHGNIRSDDVKRLKQEVAELLAEDAKADKLKRLPLYSLRLLVLGLCVVDATTQPDWCRL